MELCSYIFVFLLCVWMCVYVWGMVHEFRIPQRPEEGMITHGGGVGSHCELPNAHCDAKNEVRSSTRIVTSLMILM